MSLNINLQNYSLSLSEVCYSYSTNLWTNQGQLMSQIMLLNAQTKGKKTKIDYYIKHTSCAAYLKVRHGYFQRYLKETEKHWFQTFVLKQQQIKKQIWSKSY